LVRSAAFQSGFAVFRLELWRRLLGNGGAGYFRAPACIAPPNLVIPHESGLLAATQLLPFVNSV